MATCISPCVVVILFGIVAVGYSAAVILFGFIVTTLVLSGSII